MNKMQLQTVDQRVESIIDNLGKERVNFENVIFSNEGQKYLITGVKADKNHRHLKVFYRWASGGAEHKVNFFDFHSGHFVKLLLLVESELLMLKSE